MVLNDSLKEEHLWIKKLHLNGKGDSAFVKNLLILLREINLLGDTYASEVCNTCYYYSLLLLLLLLL